MREPSQQLSGTRVLIVEDEPIIALTLQDMLEEMGCEVVARAMTLERAVKCLDQRFDLAILDVNIAGRTIDPVSEVLDQRGIPYVLATGYAGYDIEARRRPLLQKPYDAYDLRRVMTEALLAVPRSD
jgi:CheY-like chemotaxis protein